MSYDTILVGAGSAGCVLANRLTADPSHRVLLLEAGPADKKTEIHIPAAFSKLFKTEVDWAYQTIAQPGLDGRSLYWPRGRVLGGCSSISGGAINSPQLLMLSGIGPTEALARHGIDVLCDLPGVGSNLQDHLIYVAAWHCRQPLTLANAESLGALAKYLVLKKGPLTSNVGEAGAFVRIDPASSIPDLQYHFAPTWFVDHGQNNPEGHGLGIGPTLLRPESRGSLTLASADPAAHPRIDPGYFTAEKDLETLVAGVRLAREIAAQSPLDDLRGAEATPGETARSDQELGAAIRRTVETLYHPVGTCKMGDDEQAVVDDGLRVHGIDGLRVADASIMPIIPNGNTNAPTIAIAEKAADLIVA